MKEIFYFEMSRIFRRKSFWISIMIGSSIAIGHWIQDILPLAKGLSMTYYLEFPMLPPAEVWSNWIGDGASAYSYILYLILPVLCTLPFGDTFYTDVKSHLITTICTRIDRKYYFYSKYIATFLSGGLIAICPFVINLIMTAMVLPGMKSEVAAYVTAFSPKSSLVTLFFEHPFFYIVISLVMIFVFCGFLSTMSLFVAFYTNYRFFVLLFPLLTMVFLSSISVLLNAPAWQMSNFLHPGYNQPRVIPFLLITLLLAVISIFEFIIRGKKDDII